MRVIKQVQEDLLGDNPYPTFASDARLPVVSRSTGVVFERERRKLNARRTVATGPDAAQEVEGNLTGQVAENPYRLSRPLDAPFDDARGRVGFARSATQTGETRAPGRPAG
jgi:hypothetical protein